MTDELHSSYKVIGHVDPWTKVSQPVLVLCCRAVVLVGPICGSAASAGEDHPFRWRGRVPFNKCHSAWLLWNWHGSYAPTGATKSAEGRCCIKFVCGRTRRDLF